MCVAEGTARAKSLEWGRAWRTWAARTAPAAGASPRVLGAAAPADGHPHGHARRLPPRSRTPAAPTPGVVLQLRT